MNTVKIDKETAVKELISLLETHDHVLAFGFKNNGEAALVTVTDDPLFDKLGIAMARQLERLAKEIEEELKET